MVRKSSEFSQQDLGQQLTQILGQALSEHELSSCFKYIELLEPKAGSRFWQSTDANAGIYIILAGKARLLDNDDNLIASVEAGTTFGELTLFPQADFQPHAVRASVNLTLCYITGEYLQALMGKYPAIEEHVYHQAVLRDLLLLCRQTETLRNTPVEGLMKVLSLLERQDLESGKLPISGLGECQFLLLRRGEILHSSDYKLTPGNVYAPCEFPKERSWQVTQPTELYSLRHSDWETALDYLPQLAEHFDTEGSGDRGQGRREEKGTRKNSRKVTAKTSFPIPTTSTPGRPTPSSKNQPKKKVNKPYFPNPTVKVGHLWQRITQRYPFFQQQSASDCGAACLVMIGRYWGKRFSVNRLRDLANVDRSGASLRCLAAAAESIGFATRPVKATLDKLAQQSLPAIAHWEGKHYIVVFEVTRKRVIVCDPAIGQRSLTHAEFKAGWTGYTLLLQPTTLLKETQEATQPMWQFFELVKPHSLVLLEIFIASLLIQIFGLVTPLFTQLLLDRVVVQRSTVTLTAVGLGLVIFGVFRIAITGLRQYLLDHTANKVDLALIVGFISHTFRLPLKFFESRYVGDIISRVQENRKIQRFLTGEALSIVLDILTVFVYLGLMFWYSWKMALLTLVIVPPYIVLALVATPFLQRVSREIFGATAVENSYLIQALSGINTVKSMAIEQTVRWRWEELFGKSVKTKFSGQKISNALQIFSGLLQMLVSTGLLWFGAWLVIHNELTIGQLVAFNMLLGNIISPFQRLIVLWNQLQEVVIAVERINDVLDADLEENWQQETRQTLPPIQGSIQFKNVTFRYNPASDFNILENLSFEVKPGQTVALVGRSGSGKTTLSKLILGLYPPTDGKILIDGYDVTTLSMRSLRQQVGVVDQNTFMFGGTIRENISLGHPEASLEEVIEAAKQAGAHQFIKDLPMGYETEIGEGGGMLSGGQRQRLAIARALLGNPRLLILDEATSSLDTESERIIQNNLSTILQNRTTLVIAHRLSTIRNADLILVLDKGILVESGTHDELMARRGQYFYLNQQQLAIAG